ncbi:tellurium resistance protein TerW [Pantoea sp. FN060301]|uniref:tellurium resistance protein TerW n=1 Tax=Pantoea sp. FN060301 TaxID=3420380 RepID=UPI003D17FD2D
MLLNSKQMRQFTLAVMLSPGKPVGKEKIVTGLQCSDPTLTRDLKELRETYSVEIRYTKANHSFTMTDKGSLTPKVIRRMRDALTAQQNIGDQAVAHGSMVFLDKEKKKAVSLSLRMSVIRKIDRMAYRLDLNRSEAVEKLVDACIADFMNKQHDRAGD